MDILESCLVERENLLKEWNAAFLSAYPLDSTGFSRTITDRFANPVAQITYASLALLLGAVLGDEVEPNEVKNALAELVRLRAVQDLGPAQAVAALYRLKTIMRGKVLPKARQQGQLSNQVLEQYLKLESRLDSLALLAFDLYAANREQVYELRVAELKRNQAQILRWAQTAHPDETHSRGGKE